MTELRVGLAQIAPVLGDVPGNLRKHLDMIEEAKKQNVQLLCFPELSLTGYLLKDLVPDVAMMASETDPIMAELISASQSMDLLIGFVEEDLRHRYYISAAYLSHRRIVRVHRKVYLTTYGMFEEGRYWAPGDRFCAFDTEFARVGILICEDFWHMSSAYTLWLDGADALLLISASPGRGLSPETRLGSSRSVELVNQMYATFLTNFVLHCNRVGFEDGLNFWGGSTVFGPEGNLEAQAPYFEETLLTATLDLGALRRVRIRLPLLRDERPGVLQKALDRIGRGAMS
ncbi:MAG TPA: nitrilase-related carbon-nitrogen hydrolase [Anaerolineae bacterium]|nr:nitrilase-related carbon-nitrogen hydrolase [Anaerolineae bacterium]